MRFDRRYRAALVLLLSLAAPEQTRAQDASSWSSGTMMAPQQRPGEAKLLKAPPSRPAQTGARILPEGSRAEDASSTFRPVGTDATRGSGVLETTTVRKSGGGNDPAYDAFLQGRYVTAFELATKAANAGEAEAATLLGRLYQEGLGLKQDLGLAAQWYRRAAELGDLEGTFSFAVMLAEGDGIQKNRVGAASLFDTAAQKGHALANYNLALLFLKGEGKPENPHRAAQHMRYAAEQGIAAAQYDLATLYATGTGVDANAYEAANWLKRAADQGYPDAEVEFGVWLFLGRGVQVAAPLGVHYFLSAAEKGVAVAHSRLARCYARGLGVTADLVEAAKWHLLAKSGGIEDKSLDDLVKKLTAEQRRAAERAADAWRDQFQMK